MDYQIPDEYLVFNNPLAVASAEPQLIPARNGARPQQRLPGFSARQSRRWYPGKSLSFKRLPWRIVCQSGAVDVIRKIVANTTCKAFEKRIGRHLAVNSDSR
ncbi:MAG: hypothetical protein HY777_02065 [Betaproteobacteria bacterium]|nr:hypothetical protein [Betaproteobacteria bacterium]